MLQNVVNPPEENEAETYKEDSSDRMIITILPFLVLGCLVAGAIRTFIYNPMSVGDVLLGFCAAFVFGFFFLGLFSIFFRGEKSVKSKLPWVFFGVGPAVVTIGVYIFGTYIVQGIFDSLVFSIDGDLLMDLLKIMVQIYAMTAGTMVVAYGVISVVSSCFRQYIARVYRYIGRLKNDGTDNRVGGFVLTLFDVPSIIEIERVELEPLYREHPFPKESFVSMAVSIFMLGLIICSYFFLNPILINEMTIYETMVIGILISFFIPVLIMPWYITKENGAKIISVARPLYLWKGLRKRMYQGFFAFTFILILILMSLYFGSDVIRITYTYIGYVAFSAASSVIYSYIFFNNYNEYIKKGIIRKFNE